jgi:para-nitrobenzyl esterase
MQPWPAPSFGPYTREFVETPPASEDCLFLNVWSPARGSKRLPVLVWIHGGGFLGGSGAVPIYDGARLAARGAVVVTINYRVGPFGFLAHPALSAEDPRHVSGNYGLLDQLAALVWVHRNIARFGGDPSNVTIAGQSAGAASVNALLAMPGAAGLFQRAISESGAGMGISAPSLAQAESEGMAFADYLGAKDVAALRTLAAERIRAAVWLPIGPSIQGGLPRLRFGPVLDSATLPVDPQEGKALASLSVPVLSGYTADEVQDTGVKDAVGFEKFVNTRYGNFASKLLSLYPHGDEAEASSSARLLARDRYMASLLVWAHARVHAAAGAVFLYRFDHAVPVKELPSFGAFHTAEVPYVFGTLDEKSRPWDAVDRRISGDMQLRWLTFMRHGDPNGRDQPQWPRVSEASDDVMAFSTEAGMRPAVSSAARSEALQSYAHGGGKLSLF